MPKLTKQQEKNGPGDYTVDEKSRQAFLTRRRSSEDRKTLEKEGLLEAGASLYDAQHIMLMHHLYAGLKAHALFKRDVDYIVRDGEVVIWMNTPAVLCRDDAGLMVSIKRLKPKEASRSNLKNQTLASITFQNYFPPL